MERDTRNKLFSGILIILALLGFASCGEQPLDPYKESKYIDTTVDTIPIPVETRFKIDSAAFRVEEMIGESRIRRDWRFESLEKEIYADTSGETTLLSIKIKLKCALDNNALKNRKDWVHEIEIKFADSLRENIFPLDKGAGSGRWLNLTLIERLRELKKSFFHGSQFGKPPIITLFENREKKYIAGSVKVFLEKRFQSREFNIDFVLFYKKK